MNIPSAKPSLTFSFLDILDRTFRIYRENFVRIIGFSALVIIPISIISVLFITPSLTSTSATLSRSAATANSVSILLTSLLSGALQLVELILIYSVVSTIASESLFGRQISLGEAFETARSRFGQLGCGFIIFYIVLVGLVIVIAFIAIACSPAIVAFALVAYIGITTFALLTPVIVLEDVGITTGVNRAYGLGRARFWTLLGVLATITVLTTLLGIIIGAMIGLVGGSAVGNNLSGYTLIQSIASVVVNIFTLPILPIAMTLMYYDVRSRVEGLDLALAAVEKPDPRPADVVSPRPAPPLTQRDLINIVILGVGVFVLSLVASGLLMGIMNLISPGFQLPR